MSVREARLCDTPNCNNPAKETCALCTLDRCIEHLGKRYLTITVACGEGSGTFANELLGKLPVVSVCGVCYTGLNRRTVTNINVADDQTPLSDLVKPLRAKLIESASAFLAEERLKKPVGSP